MIDAGMGTVRSRIAVRMCASLLASFTEKIILQAYSCTVERTISVSCVAEFLGMFFAVDFQKIPLLSMRKKWMYFTQFVVCRKPYKIDAKRCGNDAEMMRNLCGTFLKLNGKVFYCLLWLLWLPPLLSLNPPPPFLVPSALA